MSIKQLEKADWASYFDAFSKKLNREHRTDYAEIRVFSQEDGAQPETSWLPLAGITYDRKGDLLEVLVENMDHLVYHPKEIYVDEMEDKVLSSLEVVREDGTIEVIELR
jgi:hypothetical protein